MKLRIESLIICITIALSFGCNTKDAPMPNIIAKDTTASSLPAITVDCAVQQGPVMRIEQANVHSTTSALPGEKARNWLQALHHTTIRTWLALRTIYNDGKNYKYNSSAGATVENSLAFYSTCADSLMVALTAYNPTTASPLPDKGAPFQKFIKETLIYYKTKFPKIKYIQAGNEPDYNGESAADYYKVYQDYYVAINDANAELGLQGKDRILLSNAAFTSTSDFSGVMSYTKEFLSLYAADTNPNKRLDFFTFNCYTEQSNPKLLETAKMQINTAMQSVGLPKIAVFVSEYGLVGGGFIPSVWNQRDIMTAWAPAQLSKAFYLYEGGIDKVFNWSISHGSILHKSELGDLDNAYANPYGNTLVLCREISVRGTRIKVTSTKLTDKGLGINALASMGADKGIAVLAWNYNYTNNVQDQNVNILIKDIPKASFPGKINVKVYLIDSKNNNFYNNSSQTSLTALLDKPYDYASSLTIPVKFESNAVAMIVLTP